MHNEETQLKSGVGGAPLILLVIMTVFVDLPEGQERDLPTSHTRVSTPFARNVYVTRA